MASGSQRISEMVFERTIGKSSDDFILDAQMLRILEQLDGQSTVAQIAGRLGLSSIDLKPSLAKMYKQKLIRPVAPAVHPLPAVFFAELESVLGAAIGPIAGLVVEDCIHQLGAHRHRFPSTKTPQLVQLIATKITDPSARRRFIQQMTFKLKAIK
jgi:hypothetical protein